MTDTTQTPPRRVAAPKAGVRVSGGRLKQAVLGLAVISGIFAGADYGRYYWTTGQYLVSADDAYVDAHSAVISGLYLGGPGRRQRARQGRPSHRPH